jgi:hypothetical protein
MEAATEEAVAAVIMTCFVGCGRMFCVFGSVRCDVCAGSTNKPGAPVGGVGPTVPVAATRPC